jgi:cysteinyl-tRNA synthetase
MSKSLGNYVSFDDILSRYTADAFRYFYLSVHYRRPLDYTEQAMQVAQNSVNRLENTLDLIEDALRKEDTHLSYSEREAAFLEAVKSHRLSFETAMDDDLDTHGAIDALHALSRAINEYVSGPTNKGTLLKGEAAYKDLLEALGLFEKRKGNSDALTGELIELVAGVRERLRADKNYQMADEIRDLLGKVGVSLADTNEGTSWKIENN